MRDRDDVEQAPGQIPPSLELKANPDTFTLTATRTGKLKALNLETAFATGVKLIRAARATGDALDHPQAPRAVARAIVAATLQISIEQGIPPPSLAQLDELADETEHVLRRAQGSAWPFQLRVNGVLNVEPIVGRGSSASRKLAPLV
ncbi:hypothetical protein [Bradyrhizobium uaiense]|uniref:Uncharacterized protein n=1 Tax=Bradyrhizobium uaiense TaxID=2594946 RepID=A0A6P1BU65_9BRAD|nr:hypothetical protein [Bradyrhizobium uaiense]NEV02057.1 hypothetical protein [Bradyrhizobium uaiense]